MKNKVSVEIVVPALEETFDVFIPVNKKTLEIIYLLNKAINDISIGCFPLNDELALIDGFSGFAYDEEKTVKENKILNGSRLVLM